MNRKYVDLFITKIRTSLTVLAALIVLVSLVGCLGSKMVIRGNIYQRIDRIPNGQGLVYLYRTSKFAGKLANHDVWCGKVIGGDALKQCYADGKAITILYEDGWVKYFSGGRHEAYHSLRGGPIARTQYYDGDRSVFKEDHEIQVAERAGIPIVYDDKYLITLINKSYYPVFLEPGEYIFRNRERQLRQVRLNVEPGMTYYIKGSIGFLPSFNVKQVTKDKAQDEIVKCDVISLKEKGQKKAK